jgi:hypothetical protein
MFTVVFTHLQLETFENAGRGWNAWELAFTIIRFQVKMCSG